MTPRARVSQIQIVDNAGGLLIRDLVSGREHELHPLTAFVWKHADGRATVPELGERVREVLGPDITDAQVWAAVDVLTGAGLLEARVAPPAATERVARRDLLRQVATGTVAAAAIGAIMAPDAATGQTGKARGGNEPAKESAQKVQAEDAAKRSAEQAQKAAAREQERNEKAAAQHEQQQKHQAHESSAKAFPGGKRLPLENGWVNVGGEFQDAAWSHTGDLVVLSGAVTPGAGATTHVATLPRSARPPRALVFPCYYFDGRSDAVGRVDVLSDGRVILVAGIAPTAFLSLSGIVFRKVRPASVGEPGEGASEQESKASVGQEESLKAQEREDKSSAEAAGKSRDQEFADKETANKNATEQLQKQQAETREKVQAEQDAKSAEQASKEQESKEAAAKSQETQQKERDAKSAAEAEQKAQQEQLAKQQQEQSSKAAEQAAKTQAEQEHKTQAEQAAKSQAEQEQKVQAEQAEKAQAEATAKSQEASQKQAEQSSKEQTAKEPSAKAAQEQQQKQQAEQLQKQQAEQSSKEQTNKEVSAKNAERNAKLQSEYTYKQQAEQSAKAEAASKEQASKP